MRACILLAVACISRPHQDILMQTVRLRISLSWARVVAIALVGALPAAAAVRAPIQAPAVAASSGHIPAARATASVQAAPAQAAASTATRAESVRATEVERLAAHISKTWKKPLPESRRIVRAAFAQAHKRQLSPTLVLAVVAQESSFRPAARSGYGAQGLMQVVPRHHPEKVRGIGRGGLLAPETNIAVGTQVLAEYLERGNGQVDAALVRYSGKATAYPQKIRLFWNDLERVRSSAEASV